MKFFNMAERMVYQMSTRKMPEVQEVDCYSVTK